MMMMMIAISYIYAFLSSATSKVQGHPAMLMGRVTKYSLRVKMGKCGLASGSSQYKRTLKILEEEEGKQPRLRLVERLSQNTNCN
jgi:hypothetical protein